MDAFVLKRSSRVMPGLRGTPASFIGRGIGSRRRAGATEVKKKDPERRTGRNDNNVSTLQRLLGVADARDARHRRGRVAVAQVRGDARRVHDVVEREAAHERVRLEEERERLADAARGAEHLRGKRPSRVASTSSTRAWQPPLSTPSRRPRATSRRRRAVETPSLAKPWVSALLGTATLEALRTVLVLAAARAARAAKECIIFYVWLAVIASYPGLKSGGDRAENGFAGFSALPKASQGIKRRSPMAAGAPETRGGAAKNPPRSRSSRRTRMIDWCYTPH